MWYEIQMQFCFSYWRSLAYSIIKLDFRTASQAFEAKVNLIDVRVNI